MEYLSNTDKFDFVPKELVPEQSDDLDSVIEQSETASESLPDNHSEILEIVKQEICDYCGVDCVLRKIPVDASTVQCRNTCLTVWTMQE